MSLSPKSISGYYLNVKAGLTDKLVRCRTSISNEEPFVRWISHPVIAFNVIINMEENDD
jgi:hypothetical protein